LAKTLSWIFQLQQSAFFEEIQEWVNLAQLPLKDLLNMDQTNIRLVDPHKKSISPIGAKQV
jgi:hypothetical protein